MNYFLQMGFEKNISLYSFTLILSTSLLSNFILCFIYSQVMNQKLFSEDGIQRTLPLLGLSLTTIFCVLQYSIPLSLGLLGSLSIVRFRNPVKNSVDVSFILRTIAISLLAATANIVLLGVTIFSTYIVFKIINYFSSNFKVDFFMGNSCLTIKLENQYYLENESRLFKDLENVLGKNLKIKSITSDEAFTFLNIIIKPSKEFTFKELKSICNDKISISIFYDF